MSHLTSPSSSDAEVDVNSQSVLNTLLERQEELRTAFNSKVVEQAQLLATRASKSRRDELDTEVANLELELAEVEISKRRLVSIIRRRDASIEPEPLTTTAAIAAAPTHWESTSLPAQSPPFVVPRGLPSFDPTATSPIKD